VRETALPPSTARAAPPGWVAGGQGVAAAIPPRVSERRTFVTFTASVIAVNVASLAGNGLAFRWVDPWSMGVWHTLLLLAGYLTVFRLGLVNGMGRELPFALGRGDQPRARRIASTSQVASAAGSVLVAVTFGVLLAVRWDEGWTWRVAIACMAIVGGATFYQTYLQATFRSDSDFGRLARVHWVQAGLGLLLPASVYVFGFAGLCVHTAVQAVVVALLAHFWRPLVVPSRFDPALARELVAIGLPLFLSGYLQTLASGFDRVILLRSVGVQAVGLYAPAVAVIAAMAIVPGAIATYVYPRMSYALGQGRTPLEMRRTAIHAGLVSMAAGVPLAVAGWVAAPPVIERFFPAYVASIPAVRWSLLAGLLWCLSPAAHVLSSLKAWGSLAAFVGLALVVRWTFPWWLAQGDSALEGVALGNVAAAALVGAVSLILVYRATAERSREAAA
jgi:O-antigen/teichoic acid export membrane protein